MGRRGEIGAGRQTQPETNGHEDARRGLRDAGKRETHTGGRAQKALDGQGERLGTAQERQRQGGRERGEEGARRPSLQRGCPSPQGPRGGPR